MPFKGIVSEFMKSAEMDSLQHLVATKVIISVCELEDVQKEIRIYSINNGSFSVGFSDDQWRKLCDTVRNKLEQFGLTAITISIALEKLWPVSFEIAKWILYHEQHIQIEFSPNYSWTPHASIDYEKTAKMLIENEMISIDKRFKLACIYCLEGEVRSLWELMNLRERRCFFIRGNFNKVYLHPFVLYWTYYIQEVPLDDWNDEKAFSATDLLKYAVAHGYLNATKFFHGKLHEQLRNGMLEDWFESLLVDFNQFELIMREHYAVAHFLINERRPDYSIEHSPNLHSVFLYFLEWPLQKLFMPLVKKTRFQCEITFGFILEGILEKIIQGFKDYDYKTVFMEFWLQGTKEQKRHANEGSVIGCKIFLKFIKKYYGFVFDESSFDLKMKFRAAILQQELPENITEFGKENVEFFRFLVRERVTTIPFVYSFSNNILSTFQTRDPWYLSPHNVTTGELRYLMNSILKAV